MLPHSQATAAQMTQLAGQKTEVLQESSPLKIYKARVSLADNNFMSIWIMPDVISMHYGSSDSSIVYKGTTKVVSRFCVSSRIPYMSLMFQCVNALKLTASLFFDIIYNLHF